LAVEPGGRIHVAWPTVMTEQGAVVKALFHAVSNDGRTFTPRQRIPSRGQANHPHLVVAADGTIVVAWDESGDGSRRIAYARGTTNAGVVSFQRVTSGRIELGMYPALAAVSDGVLMAWTTGDPAQSVIRVEKVR
jgi:hypothetical protein